MRIAAVQLAYLPAYFASGNDYLSYPLVGGVDTGQHRSNREVAEWRNQLRATYCCLFQKKIERIVLTCVSYKCDLIVFPEYSIPLECINRLRDLSREHELSILAGSHRIDAEHPLFPEAVPEILGNNLHGRAISPLFIKGHARVIVKATGSRYDPDVAGTSTTTGNDNFVNIGGEEIRIWICSDYLYSNATPDLTLDIAIVISYTPALGDFAVRIQDQTLMDHLLTHVHKTQKEKSPLAVVFVNNAERGGTKVFFQNRSFNKLAMEAPDGTYGGCIIEANRVIQCGIAQDTEAVVIADTHMMEAGPWFNQYALVPIIHCTGPNDTPACAIIDFLEQYQEMEGLGEKREFLRHNLPFLAEEGTPIKNQILHDRLRHLQSNMDSIDDEFLLDRLAATMCVIHEEAPGLSAWKYRACAVTGDFLRSIRNRSGSATSSIDDAIRCCEQYAAESENQGEIGSGQMFHGTVVAELTRQENLELSGAFRIGVAGCRSGSGALNHGIQLVLHLLRVGETENALRVVDQLRSIRPYLILDICDDLISDLLKTTPKVKRAIELCEQFLKQRRAERMALQEVFYTNAAKPKGGILLYGYSDLTLQYLAALPVPKPPVVVAECRNRAYIDAGIACAREVEKLGFQVSFVSDATLAHVMSNSDIVGCALMGFNLAGPDGIINCVGSLNVATLGKLFGIEVVFVGQSFKFVSGMRWRSLMRKAIESECNAPWLDESSQEHLRTIRILNPKCDLVPWPVIDRIITDRGVCSAKDLEAEWK